MSTATFSESSATYPVEVDQRIWPRHLCGIPATCRSIETASRCNTAWQAWLCDLSVGGIGMVIDHPFEPEEHLVIQVTESEDSPAETLLARVAHVTPLQPGKWLVGCCFANVLGEDALRRLLERSYPQEGQARQNAAPAETNEARHVSIAGVTWRGLHAGATGRLFVREVHLKGAWPPAPGTILRIGFRTTPGKHARLRVTGAYEENGRWFINYIFAENPDPELVQSLGF